MKGTCRKRGERVRDMKNKMIREGGRESYEKGINKKGCVEEGREIGKRKR